MIFCCSAAVAAPSAVWETLVELNKTTSEELEQLDEPAQVYNVRLTTKLGLAGLFPRRRTSAAPPFSPVSPSGRSENAVAGSHFPALAGEKSQYAPVLVVVSVVQ